MGHHALRDAAWAKFRSDVAHLGLRSPAPDSLRTSHHLFAVEMLEPRGGEVHFGFASAQCVAAIRSSKEGAPYFRAGLAPAMERFRLHDCGLPQRNRESAHVGCKRRLL